MPSIKQEAQRGLKCKNPQCSSHCPVSTPIPQVMELFLNGEIKKAGELGVKEAYSVIAKYCKEDD